MIDIDVAIAVHVLSVIWWIGGMAFATLVVLPALRAGQMGERRPAFQTIEGRFAPQARIAVFLVGASGVYLLWRLDLWGLYGQARFWWLDAMALYWLIFVMLLFVLEPSGLFEKVMLRGRDEPRIWLRLQRLHQLLLALALIVVAGAVMGSHGL